MRKRDRNTDAFFALLRAGLWEQGVRLSAYEPVDFASVYRLASEQSVVGLIAAGLENVKDAAVNKYELLPFLKGVINLENRNSLMNSFIAKMAEKMKEADIFACVVKGQGVAQCYERPQWRAVGDVDYFLDADNYEKAKAFLIPVAASVEAEDKIRLHQGMTIDSWIVELHGTMHSGISKRMDKGVDSVQRDIFERKGFRVWRNGETDVFLPNPDNDAVIVFTHFIEHFFVGGVGLRQISDWCRLLWTYRDGIDRELLGRRLEDMGLMSEWKAFARFAVTYLGMPEEAMPFYPSSSFDGKSRRICRLILDAGNFGHNKDQSYRKKYPSLEEKTITFWRRFGDYIRLSFIFPLDGPSFFLTYIFRKLRTVL